MYIYLLVTFILFSYVCLSQSIATVTPPPIQIAHNPITEVTGIITKTVNRLWKGTASLLDNFREADRLKKIRKKYGDDYLTFSEYKLIERSRDDFNKLFRLGITLPISPQFFLYSYILFPMFTPSNPWAWRSFPSTYDFKEEKAIRTKIINKRRVRGVFNALTLLEQDYGENTSQELATKRATQLITIKQVLKTNKLEDSLNILQSWLQTEQKKASKLSLRLDFIPGAVFSDCCKALGMDALPNLPLIRRFNVGELSGYCQRLGEEDSFLSAVGIQKLTDNEVKEACYDRCISIDSRPATTLRRDLSKWLDLTLAPTDIPTTGTGTGTTVANVKGSRRVKAKVINPIVINEHNRRFALLGLNAVRGITASSDADSYRAALSFKA